MNEIINHVYLLLGKDYKLQISMIKLATYLLSHFYTLRLKMLLIKIYHFDCDFVL